MFAYRGSTALVTGASKGLGKAFAEELAARGMNLVLVARSGDALRAVAEDLGARYGVHAVALSADLADPGAAALVGDELTRRGIEVDLLVNNAGLGLTGLTFRTSRTQFGANFVANLAGEKRLQGRRVAREVAAANQ
jgi:short-subunit dehydrogenase